MLKYILASIIIICLCVLNFIKNKVSINKYYIIRAILIILFLEFTIFNINSYRTDFGNLKYMQFSEGYISNINNRTTDNTQYISIENLNSKVKSIYIELEGLEENQIVDYDIYYSDNSTSNRYLATKNYFQDVEKTKYTCISLSRKL